MTKHLRLIMLSLLAMICMGGYSQSDELYKTLSFPDENKANNKCQDYTSVWIARIGTDYWKIANFNNNNWDKNWSYIKCGRKNATSKAEIQTNTSLDAEISKIKVTYGKTTKVNKVLEYYLLIASDRDFTKNVEKIQRKLEENGSVTTDVFIIPSPAKGRYFKLCYNLDTTGDNGCIQINKIDYYKKSDKADSQIKFNEAAKEVELKTEMMSLSDLISNPNKLPLTYSTSDKGTAEELDGTLLLYKTGKVTVTASFAGDDTYAATSTSMELTIVDNRQDAGIHFAKDSYAADITGGTFNEAVLVKPEGINKVIYTISPKSEGVSIAEDGTVTYPAVDATYTVTAQFNGDDTYKPATATYTLNVVDPNFETRTVEFVAGEDKTTQMTPGDDSMSKGIITISSDRAAFGNDANYRFYKGVDSKKGETTISTKYGTITKIEFVHADTKPLSNLSTQVGEYKYDGTTEDAVWTGNSKSVLFTATEQARASKITVTVKVPIAKDYTLDENSVNTIEAYENANVTLTRKLVGDVWNTLSVPFSLSAEQAKEAFGDEVQLRELESVQDNTLNFKTVNSITAGVPCLIKLTKAFAKDTYTFTGVQTIAAKADDLAEGEVKGAIRFIGIYSPTDVTTWASADKEYAVFLGAGNQFFKAQAGTEMKGFRAFFLVPNNVPNSAVKVVIDGTATGIEDLVIDGVKANGRVYNLNGQYVGNSLNGLQPGIYIQNGKKIVVK
ncbi:putative uncharacterized protein [Prevotella sp. CAG:474]|nr:putative uncharacterized protein [Prevotella sp. CAG:474]